MRYIGNKTQLLDEIKGVIDKNCRDSKSLCDIFSGTGIVAKYFKPFFEISSNDFLYFSYCLQRANVQTDSVPSFETINSFLKMNVIDYLNNVDKYVTIKYPESSLFIKNNYSECGSRNYLSTQNALIIDLMRLELEDWKKKKLLSDDEYFYLLGAVIETTPYFSNISGTYGAFLKTWDPRALKRFKLVLPEIVHNGKENICFNEDFSSLLAHVSGDILYVDPPYNERQYLPNYHLLETIAKYDYPLIKGVTGIREYREQKSDFCKKSKAIIALEKLVCSARFKYIVFSYNTDGIMDVNEIGKIFQKYAKEGTFKLYKIPYKRFKSRTLVNESDLFELIFFIEKKVN